MTDRERIADLGIDKVNVILGVRQGELLAEMTAAGVFTPIDPAAAVEWAAGVRLAPAWVRAAQRRALVRKSGRLRLPPGLATPRVENDDAARARAVLLARPIAGASRSLSLAELRAEKKRPVTRTAPAKGHDAPGPSYVLCRLCGQGVDVVKKRSLARHQTSANEWCSAGRTRLTAEDVPTPRPAGTRQATEVAQVPWASRAALDARFRRS